MAEEETTMEFMKIGDKSLKIVMTTKEAKLYGLDEESELNSDDMKGVFSKLLARAKKEVGYKFSGERVVAEIFSSKKGGCEVFLSYVEQSQMDTLVKDTRKRTKNTIIFGVNELNGLISLCAELCERGYKGKSSVYYDVEQKGYYLLLEDIYSREIKYSFACEYGKQLKQNGQSYIKEHCRCLSKNNAITLFSTLN